MGCDGGTIPRRDELVKTKKKPETKDKDSELIFQWRYCAITQQLLQKPIVMCGLGRLYNKLTLIESLLNRETMPQSAKHIRSLKDIKDLKLTPNPAYKNGNQQEEAMDSSSAPYICPVIGLEMSGKFRFVALWSCGCAFSERALKEIQTKNCHKCQKPFEDGDVVILNGTEDDLVVMKQRMELRQQKQKKNKAAKIKVKEETNEPSTSITAETSNQDVKPKKETAESSQPKPVMKNGILPNVMKRAGSLKQSEINTKKMKADYSVAKDPKASDVYKSIFTSHKSEKEQSRAHWITYNPFYN